MSGSGAALKGKRRLGTRNHCSGASGRAFTRTAATADAVVAPAIRPRAASLPVSTTALNDGEGRTTPGLRGGAGQELLLPSPCTALRRSRHPFYRGCASSTGAVQRPLASAPKEPKGVVKGEARLPGLCEKVTRNSGRGPHPPLCAEKSRPQGVSQKDSAPPPRSFDSPRKAGCTGRPFAPRRWAKAPYLTKKRRPNVAPVSSRRRRRNTRPGGIPLLLLHYTSSLPAPHGL